MIKLIAGLTLLVGMLAGYVTSISQGPTFGSNVVGNDYQSTSTRNVVGTVLSDTTLKTGNGTLAQVTITGAAASVINLCDATTTNTSLRASTKATSSLTCWSIPASTAAGTYIFDAEFVDGLIIDTAASAATATVMWR